MSLKLLELTRLLPDRQQPRTTITEADLEQLKGSIRIHGLLSALRVRGPDAEGNYLIVNGHRRHAALTQLGAKTAPCLVVESAGEEATVLAEQIAENVIRQSLTPIEEAEAYRKYLRLAGVTANVAAEQLQVPASRISRLLALLELPESIRAAINKGVVSADTAYYLSRLPDGEVREQLFTQALVGTLTRDKAARAAKTSQDIPAEAVSVTRASFKLAANSTLTLSGPAVELESFITTLEDILKQARQARTKGFDISTLSKMYRDRASKGGAT